MRSICIGVFGDDKERCLSVGRALGRKGTESDMTIFNKREGDIVVTSVVPHMYPERIQPFLEVLNMADVGIICASKLSPEIGEMVVGLIYRGIPGYLFLDPEISETIAPIVAKTLPGWKVLLE